MLSEEQHEILSYFESLEKEYQYKPPSKSYLNSPNLETEPIEKQMTTPLFDEV